MKSLKKDPKKQQAITKLFKQLNIYSTTNKIKSALERVNTLTKNA